MKRARPEIFGGFSNTPQAYGEKVLTKITLTSRGIPRVGEAWVSHTTMGRFIGIDGMYVNPADNPRPRRLSDWLRMLMGEE